MRLWALSAVLLSCALAAADARQDHAARDAFKVGRTAYEAGDYQLAYDKFRESFQLSHEPALLYNIASALQGLKRPHDAAEALRSFLRVQQNDPDRPKIEQRIATLEEEQRMIDLERKQREEAEAPRKPDLTLQAAPVLARPAVQQTDRDWVKQQRRHRTLLAVSLTVGGVVIVGSAVAAALALTQTHTDPFAVTSLGAHPGTR